MANVGTWRSPVLCLGLAGVTDDIDRVEDDVEDVDAAGEPEGIAAMVAAGDFSFSAIALGLTARTVPTSAM